MASNLVIVESPTKARTIGKFLGRSYSVRASMGHVRDLPKSKLGVDVENDFAPQYLVPHEKSKTIKELKELVKGARTIYSATDPDREGEAIAWHLAEAINTQGKKVKRVVFHEITKEAIAEAFDHPRDIDMNLVDSQQARRILDRLVGYKISPLLWRKVKRGLSAGRVQSVALRLVVDRERDIEAFMPQEYWSIEADLAKRTSANKRHAKSDAFRANLIKIGGEKADVKNEEGAVAIVNDLKNALYIVDEVRQKEARRYPSAPFITSTLQQEAFRKLNFSSKRTMVVAQQLYEGVNIGKEGSVGLITYMRTDSTNIAASAQAEARTVIAEVFGEKFLPPRPPVYVKKVKGAQEAHEAIRPSSSLRLPDLIKSYLSPEQYRLYKLIWQRFIASQMAPAVLDTVSVDIKAGREVDSALKYTFRATGSVIKFPGFLSVYHESLDDNQIDDVDKKALPPLAKGEDLELLELLPEQHFTEPPPRFTEATLVKALEEKGIGRPSTYAPILSTLQERYYVEKIERKLKPTELGRVVNDLLVEFFPNIVDVGFTSEMEEELDEISAGERKIAPVLHEFYGPFSRTVESAENSMGRVKVADEPTDQVCEKCGKPMVIKIGRFGKFIACSGFPECRNAKSISKQIGVKCPQCEQGDLVEKRTKSKRTFYGCDRYPDCDFSSWDKPLPEKCPTCGGFMVETKQKQKKCMNCSAGAKPLARTA